MKLVDLFPSGDTRHVLTANKSLRSLQRVAVAPEGEMANPKIRRASEDPGPYSYFVFESAEGDPAIAYRFHGEESKLGTHFLVDAEMNIASAQRMLERYFGLNGEVTWRRDPQI